jgi:hypothetical protein
MEGWCQACDFAIQPSNPGEILITDQRIEQTRIAEWQAWHNRCNGDGGAP